MDGYDRPLTLAAEMTIGDGGIHVDFAGTSPASAFGINVVLNYTLAYTAFGVKCLVAPEVPNNAGSLAPITVSAPEGCLLNAKRPRAVAARHTVGHMLPDLVFGCLHQVIDGGVPAEGASSLWIPQIYGGADVLDELGAEEGRAPPEIRPFSTAIFHCGGAGARPGKDGLDVTAFPSGVRTIPVEATEAVAPVLFRRREFREGSGGAGQFRGGLGQIIELGGADGTPIAMLCNFERIGNPARGRDGGGKGASGPGHPGFRQADRPQRSAERARRRFHPPRTAGRRRVRRPGRARSGAGRGRRRRRADLARDGARRLPRRPRRRRDARPCGYGGAARGLTPALSLPMATAIRPAAPLPMAIAADIPGQADQLVQRVIAVEQRGDLRQKTRHR